MSDDSEGSSGDKTEEPTPERRDEFRKKGDVAISKEITSVISLGVAVVLFGFYMQEMTLDLSNLFRTSYRHIGEGDFTVHDLFNFTADAWIQYLVMVLPVMTGVAVVAALVTLLQSRFNFATQKFTPDYSRIALLQGLARMVSMQALVELLKSIGKIIAIGLIAYLIIFDKWTLTPGLMHLDVRQSFRFLGELTTQFLWGVLILLALIGILDYFYHFISLENKMKMSREDLKQEFKNRELDPLIRQRMRKMARDLANSKMMEATKGATVVITNPTHYAIALKYELGMIAPQVVAKGIDHLALQIREIAKEAQVPIIENPPVARALYALCKVGTDIPENLYLAVSAVIKHVFKLKGVKVPSSNRSANV
jgi:flagellar biosynthetic protein FlhB